MATDTQQATEVTVFSHKRTEYYTPEVYIEAARTVMGGIDLDPASDPFPQGWIKAGRYFTIRDDGLSNPWSGRVFLNPPYSKDSRNRSNQMVWSNRLIDYWVAGDVTEAILLVKAALGYKWFETIFPRFPVCFTRDRIRFLTEDREMPPAKQANAVFYLPPKHAWSEKLMLFKRTFDKFGRVIFPDALSWLLALHTDGLEEQGG